MPNHLRTISADEIRRRFPDMYTGCVAVPSHLRTILNTLPDSASAASAMDVLFEDDGDAAAITTITAADAVAAEYDRRDESTGWPLLLEMLDTSYLTADQRNTARSNLRRVRRLAEDHGISSAKMLPPRRDLESWLHQDGATASTTGNVIATLRKVVDDTLEVFPDAGYTPLVFRRQPHARNLRNEPDLQTRIAALGRGNTRLPSTLEIIREIAPRMAKALIKWRDGPAFKYRTATIEGAYQAVDRLLAAAYRIRTEMPDLWHPHPEHGTPCTTLTPLMLYEIMRPNPATAAVAATDNLLDDDLLPDVEAEPPAPVPLLIVLLEEQAQWAVAHATYGRKYVADGSDRRRRYFSATLDDDRKMLWQITRKLYSSALYNMKQSERWDAAAAQNRRVERHVTCRRQSTGSSIAIKDRERIISLVTYAQMVAWGLPFLRKHVYDFGEHWLALAQAAQNKRDLRAAEKQYRIYAKFLEGFILVALFEGDPMRLKNHCQARLGFDAEIRPEVQANHRGQLVVTKITTYYSGSGGQRPEAALKEAVMQGRDERERRRVWPVPPAVLDPELFIAYLLTVRRDRIIQRELMQDRYGHAVTHQNYDLALDLAQGERALFVSPKSNESTIGGFVESSLSMLYAETMHWILVNAMKRDYLPEFKDRGERGPEWAMLYAALTPHTARLRFGTYWVGVVGHHAFASTSHDPVARRLTGIDFAKDGMDDVLESIIEEYSRLPAELRAKRVLPIDNFEHPNVYDDLVFRAVQHESIDWEKETKRAKPEEPPQGDTFAQLCRTQRASDVAALGSKGHLSFANS